MTATGAWLPGLPADQARHEVCDDRDALLARGFAVRSFAHPYRDATSATEAIVRDCGHDSARGGGGFSHDLLPPRDPYFTLTPPIDAATSAAELDARVQATIDDGGGWATLAIGRVCSFCGPDAMAPQTLAAVLDRLATRRAAGEITVRTVGDAIAGPHSYEDPAVETVVAGCGYNAARTVGGLQRPACTYAETTPPRSAFDVLSADEVLAGTTLSDLQRDVTTVEHLGGGWLPTVLHRLCATPCGAYGLDPGTLTAFRDWLAARRSTGTVVRTVREVVGGPVAASPDHTPPVTTATCDGGPCGNWARAAVRVVLAATDAGSGVREIRYTVDGSDPSAASPRYSAALRFTRSTDLRFRAWDLAGNAETVRSAAIRIDTTAPVVALSAPATVHRGAPVTLQATASDSGSGVAAVTFRAAGLAVATDTTSPYSATWVPSATGRVKLTATAAGNATTSATLTVTVL